ncbi:unnamed protein product [Cyclocybe aegerita]|uniref:Uncharacterized protein n=1 Tax=Cyclocybe aegerita TaxID=1973307 RepID=A0A8S0WWX8_CYCAE|nr:unnamed protein product [Cyclocybe aegerita]
MPRDSDVLCAFCDTWMMCAREHARRVLLETPYSAPSQTLATKSRCVAAIVAISDDDSSEGDDDSSDSEVVEPILPSIQHEQAVLDVDMDPPDTDTINLTVAPATLHDSSEENTHRAALFSWQEQQAFSADNMVLDHNSDSEQEDSSGATHPVSEEDLIDDDDEDCYLDWDTFEYGKNGLSAWDVLSEGYEREAASIAEKLNKGYAKAPLAFLCNPLLPKIDSLHAHVAFLAGFKPESSLKFCPHCKELRFQANGTPQCYFTYVPIIPHLITSFSNKKCAEEMQYHANHVHEPGKMTDVFDGSAYRDLLTQTVKIDGKDLGCTYFSDDRDIAFGLSTDGFAPLKRRKDTAWPLILFNFNLPPEICFHMNEILALGVIPGPKKPVDIDLFLWPVILEFIQLAWGVAAFDILNSAMFAL